MAVWPCGPHQCVEQVILQRHFVVQTRQRCHCRFLFVLSHTQSIRTNFADFFNVSCLQGQIIFKKLRKDEIEEHAAKIREQFDNLEIFLGQKKFIATDYVRSFDRINWNISFTFPLLFPVAHNCWPVDCYHCEYDWYDSSCESRSVAQTAQLVEQPDETITVLRNCESRGIVGTQKFGTMQHRLRN